ncbi:hypothetical protein [Chryseobacterium gleum]|uniref:hypothetical protein n=1 Tax=Chryseobacterium gleum TaxID=250 RepID=UPI0028AFF0F6|nr:hypothetical protein [Chryseobacterium gleum]
MKAKIFLSLALFHFGYFLYSQENTGAIEVLTTTKISIESKIKNLGLSLDKGSEQYAKLYPKYHDLYMEMLPLYEGYKGSLTDCTLNETNRNKFKGCLKESATKFSKTLMRLDKFYLENKPSSNLKAFGQKDASAIDPISLTVIVTALVDGGIKVWERVDKKNQDVIDKFRSEIDKDKYNLKEFNELLTAPTSIKPPAH